MGNENEETGQYYYRARMYSPVQSRFISSDPMGMVDGPNMYAYVQNDPVNFRDPSGCFANPMGPPPNTFNGAGGGTDLEECPGSGYETYNACVRAQHGTPPAGYDSVAEYCSWICYGQESTSTGGSSGSGLPSFTIDDDKYQQCLQDEIVEIGASQAACIVGGVGGYAVAALLITAAGTISPDVTFSKAIAGAVGTASIVYFASIIAGCVGGWFYNYMTDGITALACGMYALEWN